MSVLLTFQDRTASESTLNRQKMSGYGMSNATNAKNAKKELRNGWL